ncbi:hypothetical protein PY093_17465 [Cytobacillus sp. S13-E01]|uniref:hypothetical protein n=1 Tax=Cytobacillus sp. S13-E01 TaxID=3031326 RepID=UPI0023D81663|nr:hypothetical protein [Cytobacillus sp. S13-E01]MDF0728429.1 hypothetical protein [Cytobacillus sp. S13-E01]
MTKMTNSLIAGLSPHLEKSNEIMEQIVNNTKDVQHEKMNEMIRYFLDSLNEVTGDHMKELGNTLTKTIEWQEKVQNELNGLVEELKESATNQATMAENTSVLTEKIGSYSNVFTEQYESILNRINENHQNSSKLQLRFEELLALILEETQGMEESKQDFINSLQGQLDQMDQRVHELRNFWSTNEEQLTENRKLFSEVNERLNGSMESFVDHMHQGLGRTFDQFDKQLAKSVEYLERGVSNIRTVIETMEEDIEKVNSSFDGFYKVLDKATNTTSRSES